MSETNTKPQPDRMWATKGTQPSDLQFTLNQLERDGFAIFSVVFVPPVPNENRAHFVVLAFKTNVQVRPTQCACYSAECEHRTTLKQKVN